MAGGELSYLLDCCEPCRDRTQRLIEAFGPERVGLIRYFADPLLSVDLRDKNWVSKFEAEHPSRAKR